MNKLICLLFLSFSVFSSGAQEYRKGSAVEVKWGEFWYKGTIVELRDGKFKVHFDGYGTAYDQWVTKAEFRSEVEGKTAAPESIRAGTRVEVYATDGKWYPATILEARSGRYKVRYDGYDERYDAWVLPAQFRVSAQTGTTTATRTTNPTSKPASTSNTTNTTNTTYT
ncbi:MAG TPA: agenet domain-containing protein, partial [Chitinophagaceae bacterium]|nr:agenet domain-containing protein [Chitinophagaceae bacterium]